MNLSLPIFEKLTSDKGRKPVRLSREKMGRNKFMKVVKKMWKSEEEVFEELVKEHFKKSNVMTLEDYDNVRVERDKRMDKQMEERNKK